MGISAITPDAASADFQAAPSGSSALGGDTPASNAPQTPSQQPPAPGDASSPVGGANAQPPQGPHQSLMADIVKAVGHILGGPTDMQSVDPNTGQINHVPLSRSARIANAASMALRGAAAGASQRGPGATGRAAAAGVQAGTEAAQQQQQNVLAQSKNQQGVLAAQGAHALQQQQIAESGWRMAREQTGIDEATADKLNGYRQLVSADPANKDWGQYASFDDFVNKHPELQSQGVNLTKLQAQGKLIAVPTTAGGKISGVNIFQVSPDWSKQKNAAPVTVKRASGLDDKGNVQYDTMTIPAQAVDNGTLMTFFASDSKDGMASAEAAVKAKGQLQSQQEKAAKLPGELKQQGAELEKTEAEAQAARANAGIKADASVYAFDPNSNQTLLTTMANARQNAMQAVRPVKEADIRNDTHDTRVLNDVASKANAVMDAAPVLDSLSPSQQEKLAGVLTAAEKDANLEVGIFGTHLPTASWNAFMNSSELHSLPPAAQQYAISVLQLREAGMGLQKVLTGSARANEQQIQALQATMPGLEKSSALARQKLTGFTQNIDMLRQGIPKIPGINQIELKRAPQP